MSEETDDKALDRRALLRRAGIVAGGVAGISVVGVVAATQAQAADNDPVLVGNAHTGSSTTSLSIGSSSNPTLSLANTDPAGPALALSAVDFDTDVPTENGPVGSLIADDYGDFWGIGNPSGGGKYLNLLYSATWAAMPIPITPFRVMDTRNVSGRAHVVGGSASYDSSGRVLSGGTGANLVLDLSDFIDPPLGLIGAVQMNLTAVLGSASGYVTVWPGGLPVPTTSAINFQTSLAIANFCQVPVNPTDSRISFKVSKSVALIADIVGFVVSDSIQLNPENFPFQGVNGAQGGAARSRPRRSLK